MIRATSISKRISLALMILLITGGVALCQKATLRPASLVQLPGETDSNSPAHWKDGVLHVYNSAGLPVRSKGPDQFRLGHVRAPFFDHHKLKTRWIEATWQDDDGTLYAWYHHEPGGLCPGTKLTAPTIGALRSKDGGTNFVDLGVVLEATPELYCKAQNGYFAGGNGDFSVIADKSRSYFYFLISTYSGPVSEQGVAIARMAMKDRDNPVGKVWKYHKGGWGEPGLGGHITPIFQTKVDWKRKDADSFWGPSIHWNTYLQMYVMLLNRTCCSEGWPQEGVYVTFNSELSNPKGWSEPRKIHDGPKKGFFGGAWYPQVMGTDPEGTDKLAGKVARFYLAGRSEWEIVFEK